MKRLHWGVISTAKIAREKVIPALQVSAHNRVVAIASRDFKSAQRAAKKLDITFAHGSYEELLSNPEIDAIYNPLPNHLHVDWSIAALKAGKHVLCEKPLGLNQQDAQRLFTAAAEHPHLKVMEAFMYRFHPQWHKVVELIQAGEIGTVRHVHAHFSYNNREADNVRNFRNMGGGGLLDIGCYCISAARLIYQAEPKRVVGRFTEFPGSEVDCFVSGILEFAQGDATISAATKNEPGQRVEIFGEAGSLIIEMPFSPTAKQRTQILLNKTNTSTDKTFRQKITQMPCNQYSAMGDAFALSVLENQPVPTPLDDALKNMAVIDALFASTETGQWVAMDSF